MLSVIPRSTSMFIPGAHLPGPVGPKRSGSGGDGGGGSGSSSRGGSERGAKSGGAAADAPAAEEKRPKFKMREETKLLLKLHVIRTKALSLETKLCELHELTRSCQECEEADERLRAGFLTKVVEIEHEVKLVKKLMLFLCRHKQMERHYL